MGESDSPTTRRQRVMAHVNRCAPYGLLFGLGVYLLGLGNSFVCSAIGLGIVVASVVLLLRGRRTR